MTSSVYASPARVERAPALQSTDVLLVIMSVIWGMNFIVVKFATGIFPPLAFNATRVALAVAVLWAIVAAKRSALPARRDTIAILLLGMLGNGFYQVFWIEGLARTSASDGALLIASTPAFIEIIGAIRGRERASSRGIAGIVLSVSGIALVVLGAAHQSSNRTSLVGNSLILVSCTCWALYAVMLRKYTERADGIVLSAISMIGGLAVLTVAGASQIVHVQWSAVSLQGWLAIGYAGVFALVIAYLCWYEGLRILGATRTSMYSNLQPLITMAAAWPLLHETPHAAQLLGGALIIGGLLLTRLSERRMIPSRA